GLRVTAPSSVRRIDRDQTLKDIAGQLGVAHLIEGSVLREGDNVRVIVQLIDPATESSRWSESYDREMSNILALQTEITRSIASAIELELTPEEEHSMRAMEQLQPQSYEAYLRGMHELRRETLRGYRSGIRIMREALEQDPDSALAHAGVAIGYSMLGHNFFPETALPKAREAALKALSLDDTLPEVHLAMGMYKMYFEWHWEDAERYLKRALALNPSLVDAHYHYAWLLELLGRDEEALFHGEQTKLLNPLSPFYNGWLADQYRGLGRFDEAIDQARYTIGLSERYPLGWFALGNTYADLGEYDEALAAHEELRDSYFWSWALGGTLAKAGRIEEARSVAASIAPENDNAIPLALISAAIEDRASMYRWLNIAREERMSWYPWLIAWFPLTEPYREEPEMRALLTDLLLAKETTFPPMSRFAALTAPR
ncbi:MAG: tetratricopeptide repeat protein, partial [Pseudomonadota bacterium]